MAQAEKLNRGSNLDSLITKDKAKRESAIQAAYIVHSSSRADMGYDAWNYYGKDKMITPVRPFPHVQIIDKQNCLIGLVALTTFTITCQLFSPNALAQTQQTPQEKVAEVAVKQWQGFSENPPFVRTQADIDRLAKTPAEYLQCTKINRFWSMGVQDSPPSGARSSDTCKWPKVAYYCLVNDTKIPNLPTCKDDQKDEVWDRAPWSAAFVSYVFRSTGAGSNFAYSGSHSTYIVEAIRNTIGKSSMTPMFFGYSIDEASPAIGDLICAPRGKTKSWRFDDIPLTSKSKFTSHCDIVVSVGKDTLEVIGGNVGDTVAKTIVRINEKGRIVRDQPDFRNWFVVIKNRMPGK